MHYTWFKPCSSGGGGKSSNQTSTLQTLNRFIQRVCSGLDAMNFVSKKKLRRSEILSSHNPSSQNRETDTIKCARCVFLRRLFWWENSNRNFWFMPNWLCDAGLNGVRNSFRSFCQEKNFLWDQENLLEVSIIFGRIKYRLNQSNIHETRIFYCLELFLHYKNRYSTDVGPRFEPLIWQSILHMGWPHLYTFIGKGNQGFELESLQTLDIFTLICCKRPKINKKRPISKSP